MVVEEVTEVNVPFVDEEFNLFSIEAVVVIVSLILGATVWNMTDSIGAYAAQRLNSLLANILGFNPSNGNSSDNGGAFD